MTRKTHPLTAPLNKNRQAKKDYSLFDDGGMYFLVKSNNSKIWCFKYMRPYIKKGALISFGSYPEVSL
jgi:hypothetical protein